MSLVSSRLSLIHACTIERNTASGTDSWGTPAPPSWSPHLTALPCRTWTPTGREVVDKETFAAVDDTRLIVAPDTDVTEADRVASVSYRGTTILNGPLSVRAVLHHKDHLELLLVRIA